MSSIIKVQNIQYTDGDAALTIADGGGVTLSDDLSLADNKKIKLGTGNDLEIYHNGSESYIADVGTGGVKFRASTIRWEKNDGSETLGGVDADGGWFFKANNTTALNIDAAGTVTKPLQPAFLAYYNSASYCWSDTTDGGEHLQTLNNTAVNTGNHYNTTNHRFIAPVAGNYYFQAQFYSNYESNYARGNAALYKNGSTVAQNWCAHWETSNTTSVSWIGPMAANDYMQFYTALFDGNATSNTYNVYCGATYTYFCGHLIG